MDFKVLGSILLIVGTSIGAGMLALPVATSQIGLAGSVLLLFAMWFLMTSGAFLILEVNLWLPTNSNLISMARATIGPIGQFIAWITCLLLLYSLLCAYIAGGSGLFHNLLYLNGIDLPQWQSALIFLLLFGGVVYLGIRIVDYVNRGLMFLKLAAYVLLVLLLTPFINLENLSTSNLAMLTSAGAVTVTVTSFGYAVIVPSLRIYFAGDVHKLKLAILIGSLVPLVCYLLWDMAIMGVIPAAGTDSLMTVMQSHDSVSSLVNTINSITAAPSVILFSKFFTSICVVTSFLGVALCLTDFLADAMRMEKSGSENILIHALTFIPPFLVVIFMPGMFLKALKYAGIYCLILLVLLPAWMAWNGRYRRHVAHGFTVRGGKPLLMGLILVSIGLILYSLWELLLAT